MDDQKPVDTHPNYFKPGNPGKQKGTVSKVKQELAAICREYVEDHFEEVVARLLASRSDKVVLQTLEFLTERGWGRVPDVIKLGVDDDSAVGVMMKIVQRKRDEKRGSEGDEL